MTFPQDRVCVIHHPRYSSYHHLRDLQCTPTGRYLRRRDKVSWDRTSSCSILDRFGLHTVGFVLDDALSYALGLKYLGGSSLRHPSLHPCIRILPFMEMFPPPFPVGRARCFRQPPWWEDVLIGTGWLPGKVLRGASLCSDRCPPGPGHFLVIYRLRISRPSLLFMDMVLVLSLSPDPLQ